jgi:hypothetical protein
MRNDLIRPCEVVGGKLESDLNVEGRIIEVSEQTPKICCTPLGCCMRCPGAVQTEGVYLCGCTRNEGQLTTKIASEDLVHDFENERTADRRVAAATSCLDIPLHAELNIVCGLGWR